MPWPELTSPSLAAPNMARVHDIYRRSDQLILVTTDRLSAFDRILGLVPYKGQVLTQLAAFWFEHTADIIPNHLVCLPDPNVTVPHAPARRCRLRLSCAAISRELPRLHSGIATVKASAASTALIFLMD